MNELPVVESCEGCGGKCCQVVRSPPGYVMLFKANSRRFEFLLKLSKSSNIKYPKPIDFERFMSVPEEAKALLKIAGKIGDPCVWLGDDGWCRFHEHRPQVCRDYEVGGEACLKSRGELS